MSIHPVKSSSDKGASLIEVLVAIVILVVGIIPAVYTARLALIVSESIKNNLTAAYLAQEGVEVIRAIRDENWFSGVAFGYRLGDLPSGYQVAWDTLQPTGFTGNPLLFNNGLYNYTGGVITPFVRRIDLTGISPDEIKVLSTVTWTERGRDRRVEVESHLFNWR